MAWHGDSEITPTRLWRVGVKPRFPLLLVISRPEVTRRGYFADVTEGTAEYQQRWVKLKEKFSRPGPCTVQPRRGWRRYPRDVSQRGQRVEAEAAAYELGGAAEERGKHTDAGQELRGGHRSVNACPPPPPPSSLGFSDS